MVDLLKSYGWLGAYRNAQSGGFGGGDIIGGPAGVHLECKYIERAAPWEWLRQAEAEARPTDLPLVVCRKNHIPWWCLLPADEFSALEALGLESETFNSYTRERGPGRRLSFWRDLQEVVVLAGLARPRLKFWRTDGPVYVAAPFIETLGYLRMREGA